MESPITGKKMELRKEMKEIFYKGINLPYLHTSYHCLDSGESFTTTEIDEINMKIINDKYEHIRISRSL